MIKRLLIGSAGLLVLALYLSWTDSSVVTADQSAVDMTEWSNFSRLSISGQKASVPSIAIQSNGNLHVAFEQGAPNEDPFYVTSSDGGSTWSTPWIIDDPEMLV